MYPALDLAKYIVSKCIQEDCPINNHQLQDILFHIQKHYLNLMDRIAFPEIIEAWPSGPVVPKVYYYYCGNGGMDMTIHSSDKPNIQKKDKNIINPIVENRRAIPIWDLYKDNQRLDSSWSVVYRNGIGWNRMIPNRLIKQLG